MVQIKKKKQAAADHKSILLTDVTSPDSSLVFQPELEMAVFVKPMT